MPPLRTSEVSYLIAQAVREMATPSMPVNHFNGCPCCSRPSNRLRPEDLQVLIRSRIS
jgi:hypothetical protein